MMTTYRVTHKREFKQQEGREICFIILATNALTRASKQTMYYSGRGAFSMQADKAVRYKTDEKARRAMMQPTVRKLVSHGVIKDVRWEVMEVEG